jgi:hypothetical protein
MVEPRIEPRTSWSVVRNWAHYTTWLDTLIEYNTGHVATLHQFLHKFMAPYLVNRGEQN